MLESWNDGPTKAALVDFVGRVTTEGPDYVAPQDRIAVFDNDGTLWCEKPTVIQGDFIRTRLSELGNEDESLVKSNAAIEAAVDGDLKRFAQALAKHKEGDDTDSTSTIDALLAANPDATTQAHAERKQRRLEDELQQPGIAPARCRHRGGPGGRTRPPSSPRRPGRSPRGPRTTHGRRG